MLLYLVFNSAWTPCTTGACDSLFTWWICIAGAPVFTNVGFPFLGGDPGGCLLKFTNLVTGLGNLRGGSVSCLGTRFCSGKRS